MASMLKTDAIAIVVIGVTTAKHADKSKRGYPAETYIGKNNYDLVKVQNHERYQLP